MEGDLTRKSCRRFTGSPPRALTRPRVPSIGRRRPRRFCVVADGADVLVGSGESEGELVALGVGRDGVPEQTGVVEPLAVPARRGDRFEGEVPLRPAGLGGSPATGLQVVFCRWSSLGAVSNSAGPGAGDGRVRSVPTMTAEGLDGGSERESRRVLVLCGFVLAAAYVLGWRGIWSLSWPLGSQFGGRSAECW